MTERRIKKPRDDLPMPHENRPVSRERWMRNREQIMLTDAHFGKRPAEWWIYERGINQPRQQGTVLFEKFHEELRPDELKYLLEFWRENYERAQEPGYSYCIGHKNPGDNFASWLEGLAAQKALYRWAGIPAAIIRQWDKERRRRAKVIRKLAKASA
jgi:hypothetical protein